ncbi:MAG: hypothetical protein IJY47_02280 [Clostridia bacterium]|nr:hypothetical protein [Clostridia bacterium]
MTGISSPKRHTGARYLALGAVFLMICLAYVIVLAVYQIRGSTLPPEEEGYVRAYTVPGVRGEIYDCNGNLLVGNSTSYDLIYEYGAMPDTRKEVNESLLRVLEALLATGNGDKLAKDYSPLEGTYPNLRFSSALRDQESDEYYWYQRFLTRQKMTEEETDAEDVVKYFVKRYQLSNSAYTNEEITDLIRLYYEMERVDFGAYQSYTVAENVNMNLITSLEESNIEGVNFEIRAERVYAYPGVASHILGRLGKITAETAEYYMSLGYSLDAMVGTSGCEEAFESWLRGKDGTMVIRYDDNGNQIEKYYSEEPVGGNDVYLTLDIQLQLAAEEGLRENVDMFESSDAGAVTVMDPNTGKVLAIASYPTYDLSQFDNKDYYNSLLEDEDLPLYNRALQGVYAPGSTYKIGAALAALEQGWVTESDTFFCSGVYPHYHHPTCLGIHGSVDVIDAIRESCNVFFYHLGDSMGVDAMTKYTSRLGLGVSTGIELAERTGIVAGSAYRQSQGLADWQKGDDLSAAIGQSDHGYTPLQLSVYLSTVVNGGTRYRAHLLDSVRKFYTGEVIERETAQVLDQVDFSETAYQTLIEGMGEVVTGSSLLQSYFSKVPVTVGGKTGTAEVDGKKDYAVFCGFAPLEDPQIVVSCIIEEGEVGGRAAYTVSKIMEEYFSAEPSGE